MASYKIRFVRPFKNMPEVRHMTRKERKSFYWIVATNTKWRTGTKFYEHLGSYKTQLSNRGMRQIRLKEDRVKYWIGRGAEITGQCHRILEIAGLVPRFPNRTRVTLAELRRARFMHEQLVKATELATSKRKAWEENGCV